MICSIPNKSGSFALAVVNILGGAVETRTQAHHLLAARSLKWHMVFIRYQVGKFVRFYSSYYS